MKTRELEEYLKEKGFKEDPLDTGCNYKYSTDHIELICYVETGIDIQFIAIYKWKNNDVKGTFNMTTDELKFTDLPVASIFRKTKNNMPQRIGDSIDTHKELEKVIQEIFELS